ncbi:CRE-ASPM-1 protein [Caenorhabditis remanei]|nr:CRE-ASPM-1 protein [Caenorhabditis remanei]
MDSTLERNKAMKLRQMAERHEQLARAKAEKEMKKKKIDLGATEKAFLQTSPSAISMKTPLQTQQRSFTITAESSSSPILSFDEKADKQMIALATWTNTMIGMDNSEELDLGATTAEACRRIQKMLSKKADSSDIETPQQSARRRYHRIFEKNDSENIRKQCKKLLDDSGMENSIRDMLSKNCIAIREEHSVYNDLALQTTLLRTFLSFHPAWLKCALEAIFNAKIDAQPKYMIRALSQFLIERVFSNPAMLKNKKFAQGSGKPIITKAGREALHHHFLEVSMKLMFLIEAAYTHNVIPNLTRIFTKSSQFKSLDDMFSELTKELLTGSSLTFRKAFGKIGFIPSYKQSFIDNYDYQAKGKFEDFSDGLILAKLTETVGEMPHGKLLLKLRDPAGDRIRKVNNVKVVLQEMSALGISTEDVTANAIVGGKKEAILAILWAIVGVRVAKERKIRVTRSTDNAEGMTTPKKRRSAVHDDMSCEVLSACKAFGRDLDIEVLDLDTLTDGLLLDKIWTVYAPNGMSIQVYPGETLWEKIVSMAELELGIPRGLDQNVPLFVKMFLERTQMVRMYEKAAKIQKMWRCYIERKNTPKLYFIVKSLLNTELRHRSMSPASSIDNGTFTIPKTPGSSRILTEKLSSSQIPTTPRFSMNSTLNDATFTVSRDSIDTLSNTFKQPKTPLRGTFTRNTITAMHLNEVIEESEEDMENDETVVPSTLKKRVRVEGIQKVSIFEAEDSENHLTVQKSKTLVVSSEEVHIIKTINMNSENPVKIENIDNADQMLKDALEANLDDDESVLADNSTNCIPSVSELSPFFVNIPEDVSKSVSDGVEFASDSAERSSDYEKTQRSVSATEDCSQFLEKQEFLDEVQHPEADLTLDSSAAAIVTEGAPEASKEDVETSEIAKDVEETPEITPEELDTSQVVQESLPVTENITENVEAEEVVKNLEETPESDLQNVTPTHESSILAPESIRTPIPTPRSTLTMEHTQTVSSKSNSFIEYEMTEEQKKNEEEFRQYEENQKQYVLRNQLNLEINDERDSVNTPELKRILRETKELKKKQEKIKNKLGAIERRAMEAKENAFIDSSFMNTARLSSISGIEEESERSDAGHDDALIQDETDEVSRKMDSLEKSIDEIRARKSPESFELLAEIEDRRAQNGAAEALEKERTLQETAATTIQKMVRGFLARRRFCLEIENWREKMIRYNQILAEENEQFERDEAKDSSVENKLRNCTVYGLVNDNLHIVHLAATIIDRITDLVPSLLGKFVVDLNGVKIIYEILAVADQGLAYTSILHPLLRILKKSFVKVPEEVSNAKIRPILSKLSPRLVLLMCKHCMNTEFFDPIIITLISIARRFQTKKESALDPAYAIRQTMK